MTVETSETQDNVETTATENTGAESQENQEQDTETGQGEQGQEPEKVEPEKPKRNRAQERIERLARENAELKRKQTEYESKQQKSEVTRPVIDDFETYAAYEEALEEYHVAKAEERVLNKLNERDAEKSKQTRQIDMESAITTFADTHADFDEVVQAGLGRELPMPVSLDEVASEFGYDSETQIRLLYELAKDEEFHEAVSSSSKLRAARLLSERVDSWSTKTAPPVSKAPKPIKPVQANSAAARDISTMNDEEAVAHLKKLKKGK